MTRLWRSLALGSAAVAAACGGNDPAAQDRPAWVTDALEQSMIRNALLVKKRDPEAKIERAFIVRSTDDELERVAGSTTPGDHPVYILEIWGEMTLCHGAPAGADPCDETDGFSVVYNAETPQTDQVVYGRLRAERLGPAYELNLSSR